MRVAIEGRLLAWWVGAASILRARGGALAAWLAVISVLAWFQGGAVLASLQTTLTSPRVNGDVLQQIFPFFRYVEPSAFKTDYVAEYYLACYPLGYFSLYASLAKLGIDPTDVSRALPHLTWVTAVVGLGAAANKLGGKLAALCAMALALGSNAYLHRTAGGLPRGFGFPILAGTLMALAYGRVWWCAACVLVGALFYPVTAVISGLSLAGLLLFPRVMGLRESSWSFARRLGFLAGTAALSAALLLPSALWSRRFGELVRPSEVREFPEAGIGGRYDASSRPPFKGFFVSIPAAAQRSLVGGAPAWSRDARAFLREQRSARSSGYRTGFFLVLLLGAAGLLVFRPAARRVAVLGLASGVGYTLAGAVAPYAYLPERYVAYAVPLLGTLAISTSVAGFFPRPFDAGWQRWVKRMAILVHVTAVLWLFAGRVAPLTGLEINAQAFRPLMKRIAALPPDALVAGWPDGAMNRVPHATRRRVLLTHEVHQAFHKGYIKEMRRRMFGLIDAYFATSVEPIIALRERLGVTHLLIDRTHFEQPARLKYFRPFDRALAKELAAASGKSFELPRRIGQASILSFRDFELLDLSRIDSAPAPHTEPPPRRPRKPRR